MSDLRLKQTYSLEGVTMDLLLRDNGTLDEREELATAVRVALGTDALADIDEILPDPDSTDRRGWWGDLDAKSLWNGWNIGCKNWLLTRAKITGPDSFEGSTLARAEAYTRNALQWFIDNNVCSRIDVVARQTELQRIEVNVTIYRGPLAEIDLQYQMLWEEEPFIEIKDGGLPAPRTNKLIRIPYRNLALSSVKPTITRTFDKASPPAAQLVLSPTAPTRRVDNKLTVPQGNLALSPTAPSSVSTTIWKEVPRRDLALSPTAPTVVRTTSNTGIYPPAKQFVLSPQFPTVTVASVYPTWQDYPMFYANGQRVTWLGLNYEAIDPYPGEANTGRRPDIYSSGGFFWMRI